MVWAHVGLHMASKRRENVNNPRVNRKQPSCSEPGSDIYRRQRVVSNTENVNSAEESRCQELLIHKDN